MPRLAFPLVLLALSSCSPAAPPPKTGETAVPAKGSDVDAQAFIELRIEPIPDYYFYLRRAVRDELIEIPAFMQDALRDLKAVDRAVGSDTFLWERLEAPLSRAKTSADLEATYETVPMEIVRDGEKIPFRDLVRTFLRSLREAEPGYLMQVWPRHKVLLEARRATHRQKIRPVQPALLHELKERLGLTPGKAGAVVFMLTEAPDPDVHAELAEGGELNAVRANGASDVELMEETLHAAIFSLDSLSRGQGAVLEDLARELRAAGVEDTTMPSVHSLVKLAVYTEAGEIVKAEIAKGHTPIGYGSGLFERDRAATEAVVAPWKAFHEGRVGRPETISAIVTKAAPLAKAYKEKKAKAAADEKAKVTEEKAKADARAATEAKDAKGGGKDAKPGAKDAKSSPKDAKKTDPATPKAP